VDGWWEQSVVLLLYSELEDGGVVFLPVGPPHQLENMEATMPLRAIRVELKKSR